MVSVKGSTHTSALTVDVEDGLSLAMRDVFNSTIQQTDRVYRTTREVLDILSDKDVKATFFTLGMVAEDFPQLIREIVSEGHELAVHGYSHYRFFQMSRDEAYTELSQAKDTLEQIGGVEVNGHRAPAFSISKHTPWAFDVLIELGFTYDSSIMPRKSSYYGWQEFPDVMTEISTKNGSIIEFPISTISIGGKALPFSGGSFFRVLPLLALRCAFSSVVKNKPSVLYVHPYEFDREPYPSYYFDEMKQLPWKTQLKLKTNFLNREKSFGKLTSLLDSFSFDRMDRVISSSPGGLQRFEI